MSVHLNNGFWTCWISWELSSGINRMLEGKKNNLPFCSFPQCWIRKQSWATTTTACCGLWDSCQTMSPPVWTTCWPSACRVKVTWRTPVRRACGLMCGTVAWEGHQPRAISLPSSPPALTTTALRPPLKPTQRWATAPPQTSCCLVNSVKSSFQWKTLSYTR